MSAVAAASLASAATTSTEVKLGAGGAEAGGDMVEVGRCGASASLLGFQMANSWSPVLALTLSSILLILQLLSLYFNVSTLNTFQ